MPQDEYPDGLVEDFGKGFGHHVEEDQGCSHLDGASFATWLCDQGWQPSRDGQPDDDVGDEIASAWFESAETVEDDETGEETASACAWEVIDRLRQRGVTFARAA